MAVSYPNWINPYPGHADFIPKHRTIVSIVPLSSFLPASIVTTSDAHRYGKGSIVRLDIPLGYGMQEINTLYAPIIPSPTNPNTFAILIDSRGYSPFTIPVDAQQIAQSIPISELNEYLYNATFNKLLQSLTI